jgi:DHA3 family multidrug efflux protein-like MFS transporter
MSLMDPYGLTMVSVEWWGIIFGVLSLGFIAGGLLIAKFGLGKNPLRTMFLCNIIMWTAAAIFTVQPWLWLLIAGMAVWMTLIPFIEASEQTILQKVVPPERQGRVFGFAQSVEQSATPITAFLIGPLAQFVFIPFMTTGRGVDLIGSWFGVGMGRGIALVFIVAGVLGLIATIIAMNSKYYRQLSKAYLK